MPDHIWHGANHYIRGMFLNRALISTACCACVCCGRSDSQSRVGALLDARWTDPRFVVQSRDGWDSSVVELPRLQLRPSAIPDVGRVIAVDHGADLQKAIDRARGGDILELAPGARFVGPILLRRTVGDTGWITLRTKGVDLLVPKGKRMTPKDAASIAKITSPSITTPALQFSPHSFGIRLVGLEISTVADVNQGGAIVEIGSGSEAQTAQSEPQFLLLDRLWIHGSSLTNLQRCVTLNSASTAITNSWLSDCHGKGFDSQAIIGWNGSGPYKISNNYLEGAGENIMFGGADPTRTGVVPSDIEIVQNHFFKPAAWAGGVWTVKNLFELKIGVRVLVQGNVFENNWSDAQDGFAIMLKSTNQGNRAPWSQTANVTFRSNIIRNVAHGLTAAGHPEGGDVIPMAGLNVANNLFVRVGNGDYAGGRLWQVSSVDNTTFSHNTGFAANIGLALYGGKMANLTIVENVFGTTQKNYDTWNFAVSSMDGAGFGTAALAAHTSNWTFHNNLIPGASSAVFPAGNTMTADFAALQLTGWPDNLVLPQGIAHAGMANAAATPGVDFKLLNQLTAGVVVAR